MYLPLSFVNNDNRYSVNRGNFKTIKKIAAIKTMKTVLRYKRKKWRAELFKVKIEHGELAVLLIVERPDL